MFVYKYSETIEYIKNLTTFFKKITEVATWIAEAATGGVLLENVFWKISLVLQENTCWSLVLLACKFFKKRLQHKCFPVKFEKLLRTAILKNIC